MLDTPDSDANAAAFIRFRGGRGADAFPKVRLTMLIEVGTHAVIDAEFGADAEQVQARGLLDALQPGMLLLAGPVGDQAGWDLRRPHHAGRWNGDGTPGGQPRFAAASTRKAK